MAAEETREPLTDADQPIPSVHFTGFSGGLLVFDRALFWLIGPIYICVLLLLVANKAWIWCTTLAAVAFLILVSTAAEHACSRPRGGLGERSVLRFVYTFPIAFISLYAASVTHGSRQKLFYLCSTGCLAVLAVIGWLAVLSIALGALKIDCNASPSVSRRVRTSKRYLLCHLLFRISEISFRLTMGIVLCEGLGILIGAVRWIPGLRLASMPIFLCVPFVVLVALYMRVLTCANRLANKSPDSCLSSLVVGLVTLFMNPLHFFERPGFGSSVRRFNKWLFLIRFCELSLTLSLICWTASLSQRPHELLGSKKDMTGLELLGDLGPFAWTQLAVSFGVHYMVMVLNSDINHSTCQRLSRVTEQTPNAMVFRAPARNELYVPPPPSRGGLCAAWVEIGGSLPFADFPEECSFAELVEYRLQAVLGSGSYGVVVKAQKVAQASVVEAGEPKCAAVKLLNRQTSGHRTLAQREAKLYTKIWLSINDLANDVTPPADDLMPKAGHPFIVRLLFWSEWDSECTFHLENGNEVESEVTRTRQFSMALVMELCDSNLENRLALDFGRNEEWFRTLLHFLAEIQLALAFLHRTNVAYRDLKPENVLVVVNPSDGQVHCKLADFGFAREVDPYDARKVHTRAGTPYFFAPEVETGKSREPALENAVDVYSYGSLAYALGHGPGYCREGNTMGNRRDHPRCHNCVVGSAGTSSRSTSASSSCPSRSTSASSGSRCHGCLNVARLQTNWGEEFREGEGRQLAELVASCVDNRPQERPSIQSLQGHELFRSVSFKGLLEQGYLLTNGGSTVV